MSTTKKIIFFSFDSLTIYGGDSSTSPIIGKFCGDSISPSHVSSSNEVLIHFQSDDIVWLIRPRTGFKMEYNPIGKTHQFKTTLNNMGIIIEKYGSTIHSARSALFCFLNTCASINFF